jgi:hypothetical protein
MYIGKEGASAKTSSLYPEEYCTYTHAYDESPALAQCAY